MDYNGTAVAMIYGMTRRELNHIRDARFEQKLRELHSDLADMVAAEEITEEQANQWASDLADRWVQQGVWG